MNLQDCIDFATQNPFASMATMDGNQPRVRTLMLDQADDTGFYFTTLTPKAVYRQLRENPRVEVCFLHFASDFGGMKQMRVTGIAELSDNAAVREKALKAREGLTPIIGQPPDPITAVFRIHGGEIHFWTIMDILKEPQLERVKF